jgi:cytochrome P450
MQVLQEGVLEPGCLPSWLPTPARLRRQRMMSVVNSQVFDIIDEADSAPGSLLAQLKAATDDDGGMTREQLRDEVVTLFLAGHETTALALTWTLYLTSLHPEVELRIVDEVESVAGTERLSADHFESLKYTRQAIQEAMRLYPPVYVVPRVCRRALDLAGYRVCPGAEVWCWIYFLQRDARYFRRPERFDPARFDPEGEASQNPKAYLPFGAGTRSCVGRHLAMLEAVLAVAGLLRRFRWTALDGRPLKPRPRITLAPERAVMMRVEPRSGG